MLTRMALGFVCSLILMLQSSQDYPTKPVRVIEPFGAGGGVDVMARAISPRLSELWGQPVTVENHPGEGSTAAPALVAKSPTPSSPAIDTASLRRREHGWAPLKSPNSV